MTNAPKETRKTTRDSARDGNVPSRQAILEAAAGMMANKGYSGTSISMICKAAHCPPSSLYWHYGSKENLFAEVVKWKSNQFFEIVSERIGLNSNDEISIENTSSVIEEMLQSDPTFLRFVLLLGLERQDMPEIARSTIVEVREAALQLWKSMLRGHFRNLGEDRANAIADEYAEFGRSLTDGAFFAWDFGDGANLARVFRQFMQLMDALNDKYRTD